VRWLHRNAIIQSDDDEHSVSVSPSVRSLQGTTYHLTVHSVKVAGKYQCQVFTIQGGNVTDQLTHQVSIGNGMYIRTWLLRNLIIYIVLL